MDVIILRADGTVARTTIINRREEAEHQVIPDSGETPYIVPPGVVSYLTLNPEPLRAEMWEQVKAKREAVINGGAMTPIGVVDSDLESRTNIVGAAMVAKLMLDSGQLSEIDWTDAADEVHTLDAEGVIAMGLAVASHVNAAHSVARQLRAALEAAGTVEALLLLDIDAPWA